MARKDTISYTYTDPHIWVFYPIILKLSETCEKKI